MYIGLFSFFMFMI